MLMFRERHDRDIAIAVGHVPLNKSARRERREQFFDINPVVRENLRLDPLGAVLQSPHPIRQHPEPLKTQPRREGRGWDVRRCLRRSQFR
jgi:hypothetical protein